MSGLDFHTLRRANVKRCGETFHPLDAWSLTDWACAAAGETGEACNVVKKIRRLDGLTDSDANYQRVQLYDQLEDEMADAVTYFDLLAARAGIDLGAAVRRKFNEVSERVGSAVRL